MIRHFNVLDFLDRAVTVYPDRVAIVDEPNQPAPSWGELTYREVMHLARAQAARLDQLDVPVGGRVAFVSTNAARLYTSFFGVSGWGRTFVPVNFRLTPLEVEYIIRHSGAEVVILDPELAHLAGSCGSARHVFIAGQDDEQVWGWSPATGDRPSLSDASPRPWPSDEDVTATINYTSGTTARPKGVEQTHRALWTNATLFGWQSSVSDRDVYLHTLPMFHCNGWGQVYAVTGMGGQHIVLRQVDGTEILRRMRDFDVTFLCCAPAVVSAVLDALREWEGEIPGRDRARVVVAGAAPPTRVIERVREQLGWEFIQLYGLTESSPLLTMSRMRAEWDDLESREQARLLGRAGAPALSTAIAISTSGEILAQSNTVLKGYWDNPEATAEALEGGWFHTGDGGCLEDGYLSITDRKKDVIITGGENVSSIEVEDVLMSHRAVKEAAVIGIPDEKWGELVTALVVLDPDAEPVDDAALLAHCRASLAGYKCPKKVEFRTSLARTATGKLQKFKLREDFRTPPQA
ncbi:MAG: hypothetical protein QOH68_4078 [Nocardioidaceae bacterium]|jgi:acyl-CoA synthetase (AMP-forming)/AMP-acid ligase II|nr:hypothetical protein [Nocardioidaceae bacterium]